MQTAGGCGQNEGTQRAAFHRHRIALRQYRIRAIEFPDLIAFQGNGAVAAAVLPMEITLAVISASTFGAAGCSAVYSPKDSLGAGGRSGGGSAATAAVAAVPENPWTKRRRRPAAVRQLGHSRRAASRAR